MRQNEPLLLYISGPITNDSKATERFALAEKELRALGFNTINPMELAKDQNQSWTDCMRIKIPELVKCDALVSLDSWIYSRESRLERLIAGELAMLIFEGIDGAAFWMELKRKSAA
jgi:hypothetical protein